MKIKFFLGILLMLVVLMSIKVESKTQLSNCLAMCSDTSGCTCPNYCTITGDVNQDANCGGEVTTCSQENRRYWIRDKDCQSTCGDYDSDFMIKKGWTRVDYDCYTETATVEKEIIKEEPTKGEIVEIIEEPTQESFKGNSSLYILLGAAIIIVVLVIVWMIFKKRKR